MLLPLARVIDLSLCDGGGVAVVASGGKRQLWCWGMSFLSIFFFYYLCLGILRCSFIFMYFFSFSFFFFTFLCRRRAFWQRLARVVERS